jgi:hypothetical protein
MALEFLGRDADRVSREETAEADGYTDVHFRVKVKFPRPVEVRSITLRAAGEGDRPLEPGYGTLDPEGPLLVVEQEGRRLNQGFSNRLTRIEDEATLDLYLGDNGTLNLESRVLVEIAIEDGPLLRRAFTLAPPANRLFGTWQVHCAPGPTAFEPMTLSGRLWIDLGEGGEATGNINGIPLTGTVAGDSIVLAGESSLGRASLLGALARPGKRRGRPSASGWLEYEPVEARCGSGLWRTE